MRFQGISAFLALVLVASAARAAMWLEPASPKEVAEPGRSTLRLHARADRDLDLELTSANGGQRLTSVLHRIAR